MARDATVARNDDSAWHDATVASHATLASPAGVAGYAIIKGELRVPNTLNFSVFPTLDPFAKAVYYQLFLLSRGFRKDTCLISLAKLARVVLMSQRKVQDTIACLEKRGLVKKLETKLGGPSRGILFRIPVLVASTAPDATPADSATRAGGATLAPHATQARDATVAPGANNKEEADDDLKKQSSSNAERLTSDEAAVENHSSAAVPRESQESGDQHLTLVQSAYERATGNRWNRSDHETYVQNGLRNMPADKIISALEAVANRTPARINSFRYLVRNLSGRTTRAAMPGTESNSSGSCEESATMPSAASTTHRAISSKTSNAGALAKPYSSTTTSSASLPDRLC